MAGSTSPDPRMDLHLERLDRLEIPPLPAVALRVLRLAADPTADAKALSTLVERDPGLAATVLRVVRSPVWAGAVPVTSLQQAIARMGSRPLTELVVAACLKPGASAGPNTPVVAEIWRHAVATAGFARRITAARRRHVESAYLCGLLHSIGELILLQTGRPVDRELLVQHGERLGARAARQWQLPDAVASAIAYHRRWAGAATHGEEAATTWLASRLALAADDPAIDEDPVLERLTLYPDDLAALRAQRDAVREEAAVLA